ncbi:hypothetical protein SCB49_08938 [unidentified eubacterium SCB49]|nr:hypothetical protein SCB49_08938 [unidentified eubacterium SCB49]
MTKSTTSRSWATFFKDLIAAILDGMKPVPKRTWHQHVVPYEGDWAVRREGNKNISSKHKKQSTAINKAKAIAKKKKADVIIHGLDGKIRDRISYD